MFYERQGASRRFFCIEPAASALPLTAARNIVFFRARNRIWRYPTRAFQNWYSAFVILKELATEESLDGSRRSFTSCLGSGGHKCKSILNLLYRKELLFLGIAGRVLEDFTVLASGVWGAVTEPSFAGATRSGKYSSRNLGQ